MVHVLDGKVRAVQLLQLSIDAVLDDLLLHHWFLRMDRPRGPVTAVPSATRAQAALIGPALESGRQCAQRAWQLSARQLE